MESTRELSILYLYETLKEEILKKQVQKYLFVHDFLKPISSNRKRNSLYRTNEYIRFMSLEESPTGIRILDVVIGFAIIFLGVWIVLDTTILEATLVFLLAVGLIFIGFTRLGKGIIMSEFSKSTRAIKISTGLLSIALAIGALYSPILLSMCLSQYLPSALCFLVWLD